MDAAQWYRLHVRATDRLVRRYTLTRQGARDGDSLRLFRQAATLLARLDRTPLDRFTETRHKGNSK